MAESICLNICACYHFVLIAKPGERDLLGAAERRNPRTCARPTTSSEAGHLRLCRGSQTVLASAEGSPVVVLEAHDEVGEGPEVLQWLGCHVNETEKPEDAAEQVLRIPNLKNSAK